MRRVGAPANAAIGHPLAQRLHLVGADLEALAHQRQAQHVEHATAAQAPFEQVEQCVERAGHGLRGERAAVGEAKRYRGAALRL